MSNREYPSIDILAKDAIVSQPLEICERVSEYGCVEKYLANRIGVLIMLISYKCASHNNWDLLQMWR